DVKHKLAYDLYYVKKVGMWMDIRVLLSTVFHIAAQAFDAIGGVMVSRYSDQIEQELLDAGTAIAVQVVRPPASMLPGHVTAETSRDVDAPARKVRRPAPVNGNGNGHANGNGNGNGHANGNGNGNGHANGNGNGNGHEVNVEPTVL